MREKFDEILKKHGIYGEDVENVLNAVSEIMECVANTLREKEPYAVICIRNLDIAAYEVFDLASHLDE